MPCTSLLTPTGATKDVRKKANQYSRIDAYATSSWGVTAFRRFTSHSRPPSSWQKSKPRYHHYYMAVLAGALMADGAVEVLCLQKPLQVPVTMDCTISRRPDGKWVLNVPCDARLICSDPAEPPTKIAGMDPGILTMVTVYNATDKNAWQIRLKENGDALEPLIKKARVQQALASEASKNRKRKEASDQSRVAQAPPKDKKPCQEYAQPVQAQDVTNYSFVVHGDISVKSIVKKKENEEKKGGRKLSREAKDRMYIQSHYNLKQPLKHQAQGTGCMYKIQNESWISKTCGRCNGVIEDLTLSDRTFECSNCRYRTHQDVNGARNILRHGLVMWNPPPKN